MLYQENYEKVISFVKNVGKGLTKDAGNLKNISTVDEWLTKKDIEVEREFAKLLETFPGNNQIFSDLTSFYTDDNVDRWVVDPISHTYSFIRGLPHFSVVISHLNNGKAKFACVYDVMMDELFSAEAGKGAYLNGVEISVNKTKRDKATILFDYYPMGPHSRENNLNLFAALTHMGRVKSYGSYAVHYAYVACGRAEVAITQNRDPYPEFAGSLLVKEAGGSFSDFNGNELDEKTRGVLATNGDFHQDLLEIVKHYQI